MTVTTPICDFLRKYEDSHCVRMHMPGHKGRALLGCEPFDLTEIDGADNLFAPSGIIAESEANASALFGCTTCYSTEGSSLCIRTMVDLVLRDAQKHGRAPVILAARNAHRSFISAAALCRCEVIWLPSGGGYLTSQISAQILESALSALPVPPAAVWLTAPDYLGNLENLQAAARICHAHGTLLAVDGAHGAYLRFLPQPLFPTDLGADLCCTSAHKTLPALTGAAYLHLADSLDSALISRVKTSMALFASTSPSYLILASLDRCNRVLSEEFPHQLARTVHTVSRCRDMLTAHGFTCCGTEPMKLTIDAKPYGYTGAALAEILKKHRIYAEFYDPDYLVLMPSPYQEEETLLHVCTVLCEIPQKCPRTDRAPAVPLPPRVCSPAEALFAPSQRLPLAQCEGRVCAELAMNCPPAVSVVMAGERITQEAAAAMRYYGTEACTVLADAAR